MFLFPHPGLHLYSEGSPSSTEAPEALNSRCPPVSVPHRSLSPPAGRCWWCFHSWKETPASPSPIAWLTARPPRPPWETGPPPRPPTAPSSLRTSMGCTGRGRYDHRHRVSHTNADYYSMELSRPLEKPRQRGGAAKRVEHTHLNVKRLPRQTGVSG